VLAHEPTQRRALVGGVVVDVRAGVALAPGDGPVDEALEDLALAVAIACPRSLVAHRSVLVSVAPAEQVLEPARRFVEGMALEVEPDVAERRLGQEPESAPLLVGQISQKLAEAPPAQPWLADRRAPGRIPKDRRAAGRAERLERPPCRLDPLSPGRT
jgi:hypothetical protein